MYMILREMTLIEHLIYGVDIWLHLQKNWVYLLMYALIQTVF